jgi:hypothetical protein
MLAIAIASMFLGLVVGRNLPRELPGSKKSMVQCIVDRDESETVDQAAERCRQERNGEYYGLLNSSGAYTIVYLSGDISWPSNLH